MMRKESYALNPDSNRRLGFVRNARRSPQNICARVERRRNKYSSAKMIGNGHACIVSLRDRPSRFGGIEARVN